MASDPAGILPGTLDLLILKAVSLRGLHGYGVLLPVQQMTHGAPAVEQGALYPALYRLERQGLLTAAWGTSENNRRAKFYRLTAAGRKRLREEPRRGRASRSRRVLRLLAPRAPRLTRGPELCSGQAVV